MPSTKPITAPRSDEDVRRRTSTSALRPSEPMLYRGNDATSAAHLARGPGAYVWQIGLSSVPPPPVHQDQYQDQCPYQDQDRCPPGCRSSGTETAAAQAPVAYSAEAAAANKAAAAASPPPPPPAGSSGFELRLQRQWRRRAGSSRSRAWRSAVGAAVEEPPSPRGGW
jgi:hypothetical protein